MNLPAIETPALPGDLNAPCISHAQYAEYGSDVKSWRTMQKVLTGQRLDQTRPLDESKKKIMEWFKGPLELLESAIDARTSAMLLFKQAEDAAAKKIETEALITGDLIISAAPKAEGISYRDVWKFNIEDESLIPRGYLIPDLVKIGAAVRYSQGVCNIPGIRVYSEKTAIIKGA